MEELGSPPNLVPEVRHLDGYSISMEDPPNSSVLVTAPSSVKAEKRKHAPGEECSRDLARSAPPSSARGGKRRCAEGCRLLACPFYQNSPGKFRTWSTVCSGPGFEPLHRLKEHILRQHAPPKYTCERCGEDCESDAGLSAHRRSPVPCELKATTESEGMISLEAAKLLRGRQQWKKDSSDEEKWRELFRIIYPNMEESQIPSAYYNDESTVSSTSSGSTMFTSSTGASNSSQLSEYAEYLRRPLAGDEEQRLGSELGLALGITAADPETYRALAQMFRDQQLKDLRAFGHGNLPVGTAALVSAAEEPGVVGGVQTIEDLPLTPGGSIDWDKLQI